MTVKEARIILLCNNVLEVIYAQSKGALSKDLLSEEDNYDLNELKKQAIEIVLKELDKQDTEINKLNNVIDELVGEVEVLNYETIGKWCNKDKGDKCKNCDTNNHDCIKEYFINNK